MSRFGVTFPVLCSENNADQPQPNEQMVKCQPLSCNTYERSYILIWFSATDDYVDPSDK